MHDAQVASGVREALVAGRVLAPVQPCRIMACDLVLLFELESVDVEEDGAVGAALAASLKVPRTPPQVVYQRRTAEGADEQHCRVGAALVVSDDRDV